MCRRLLSPLVLLLLLIPLGAQKVAPFPQHPPKDNSDSSDDRLPNGKSRQEEVLKSEYEKALQDVKQMVELSTALQKEMQQSSASVLSLSSLHKAEEIEKLAKRVRSRMVH